MFELCEVRTGHDTNLELYPDVHDTDQEHNSSFIIVVRICDPINVSGPHYMDGWFINPASSDHL
jgi:hypothetical protein